MVSDPPGRAPGSDLPPHRSRPDQGREGFRRDEALRQLAEERFDVLVVGGGVTGAGVALDAASRGLRTALVEQGDFASGTSSKSSKMVHGGIRYLQQREIRLVYENLAERQRLLQNAPHLVTPLPFLIPLFGRDGVVSKTVARSYATALWLYDLTGGMRIGRRHRRVAKHEALAHLPTLRADRLVAGFLYFDARADDARLTLTLVRTAVLDYGAVAANYTPVAGLRHRRAGSGDRGPGPARRLPGGRVAATARRRRSSSTCGRPWWSTPPACGRTTSGRSTRPPTRTRSGRPRACTSPCRPPGSPATSPPWSRCPEDRRSIFVVPWPEAGMAYVGTTDTDYDGAAGRPGLHPRGRRLPARGGQRRHHLGADPGRRHRGLGRPAPAAGPAPGRPAPVASAPPTSPAATPCAPPRTAWSR